MIRNAKVSDIPKLLSILKHAHKVEQGRYRQFAIDEACFKELAFEAIRSGNMFLAVIDHGEGPIGFLMGVLERLYLIAKVRYATDLFFVCDQAKGREIQTLLKKFENWAENHPDVVEIWLGVTSASRNDWQRLGKFYQKHGYAQEGAIFQRRISSCQA